MSEGYVYTQGDITIEPYNYVQITKLKLIRELNEHAKLYISGIISDEYVDNFVEAAGAEETIKVSVKDDEMNITVLFEGIVTKVGIKAKNNVRTMEIEALSKTFLMDIKKNSGTFQNENLTYEDVFNQKNRGYSNIYMVAHIIHR
jgi:hypothetical protein